MGDVNIKAAQLDLVVSTAKHDAYCTRFQGLGILKHRYETVPIGVENTSRISGKAGAKPSTDYNTNVM